MKKQIKIEIEVIDDEHCSKKCRFKDDESCCYTDSYVSLVFDSTTETYFRSDKCKQAEIAV